MTYTYVEGSTNLLKWLREQINHKGGLSREDFEVKKRRILAPGVNVEEYIKTGIQNRVFMWKGDRLVLYGEK